MGRGLHIAGVALALSVELAGTNVQAGAAIELVEGRRHRDATAVLAPFFAELASLEYPSGRGLVPRIHQALSTPSDPLSPADLGQATRLIATGRQAWISGEVSEAKRAYAEAIAVLDQGPVSVAGNRKLRDERFDALVGWSLAANRLGDVGRARVVMERLIRSYPGRDVSRRRFGPEGHGIFRRVRGPLERVGKGTLVVDVPERSVVFVNERFASVGGAEVRLFPGKYRVHEQRGRERGRTHNVIVAAGKTVRLSVPWQRDRALRTSGRFVGFELQRASRVTESQLASWLGRALDEDYLVVAGVIRVDGKWVVRARRYSATGKLIAAAALPMAAAPPSVMAMRDLARRVVATPVRRAPARSSVPSVWAWLAAGAGVAAVASGGYLVSIHGDGSCDRRPGQAACPTMYNTRASGYVAVGIGGALLATGVTLWLWPDNDGSPTVVGNYDGRMAWLGLGASW